MLPSAHGNDIPDRFESTFLGKRALQEYTLVKLWEMDVNPVFDTPIPTLLPYVPLMKGGADEGLIRRAAVALQGYEEMPDLYAVLEMAAAYVTDPKVLREILRWDML